ncbi:AMP-binding protein [Propioniciclava flava]
MTWRLLLESGWRREGLKALTGGEALPADLAADLLRAGAELWNMYGPTETTVWSSVWRVTPGPIALGDPVANTDLYVLDDALLPVPQGVAGELWIGGQGLAAGYLDRPELTAERFRPSPHPGNGERIYRTGDLVRRRHDGALEFLGRIDHQVKLRGHRIELGEIEARLAEVDGVGAAVAVVREDSPGQQQLVAYVVPEPDAHEKGRRRGVGGDLECGLHRRRRHVRGRLLRLDEQLHR